MDILKLFAACFDRSNLSLSQGRPRIFGHFLKHFNRTSDSDYSSWHKKNRFENQWRTETTVSELSVSILLYWIHIKSAEETATSFSVARGIGKSLYYLVINFVSLKPTGVLIPSVNSQLRDNAVVTLLWRCNAALRQCYLEVCLFRALSLPDRTV